MSRPRRALLTLALLVLTVAAVGGHNRYEGPTVLRLTHSHGVHAGDVPLVLLAGVALVVLWLPAG